MMEAEEQISIPSAKYQKEKIGLHLELETLGKMHILKFDFKHRHQITLIPQDMIRGSEDLGDFHRLTDIFSFFLMSSVAGRARHTV